MRGVVFIIPLLFMGCGQPRGSVSALFIGDSIIARGAWASKFPGDTINQCAKPGAASSEIVSRCTPPPPVKVNISFIMMGTNDLYEGKSDEEVLANYRTLIATYKMKSAIVIQSILPASQDLYSSTNSTQRILALNAQIKHLAASEGVKYLDLFPIFSETSGDAKKNLFLDGMHPNAEGYKLWVESLNELMERD